MYSGLMSEKPSSRVREPPGGRSNNIFGTDLDHSKKENVRPISNIDASVPVAQNPSETPSKTAVQGGTNMKSILFGEDNTQQQVNAAKKKTRTGVNPITGQRYDEEEGEEEKKTTAHTENKEEEKPRYVHNTKYSQPPGGRSTKLW